MSTHPPMRPSWHCAGCGTAWPCPTRRRQLLAEYDGTPVSLALLMSGYLDDAATDLPDEAQPDLYHRFIAWTAAAART